MKSTGKSSKKRKGDRDSSQDSEKKRQPSTQASAKDRLHEVGVPIGSKTTRERLLQLLNKHVTRKRLRTEDQPKNNRCPEIAHETIRHNTAVLPVSPVVESQGSYRTTDNQESSSTINIQETSARYEVDDSEVQETTVDYSQFQDRQMVQLLRMVGVNAEAFDRKALIHQCETYRELIIVPDSFYANPTDTNSSDVFKSAVSVTAGEISSRLSKSMLNVHIQSTKNSHPSFSNAFRASGSLEGAGSRDSIVEEARDTPTPQACPSPLPNECLTKETKNRVSPSEPLKGSKARSTEVHQPQQEDNNESKKTTRRTRNSIAKKGLEPEDSSEYQKPSRRTRRSITKKSLGPDSLTGEPLALALMDSRKGKSVVREGVASVESDPNSAWTEVTSLGTIPDILFEPAKRMDFGSLTKSSGHPIPSSSTFQPNVPSTSTSTSQAQLPYASTSGTKTTSLPSLEHRRLSYPRPNPTYATSAKSKSQNKNLESEWEADSQIDNLSEATSNVSSNFPNSRKRNQALKTPMSRKIPSYSNMPNNPSEKPPPNTTANATEANTTLDEETRTENMSMAELQTRVVEDSRRIQNLEDRNHELNEKVDSLTDDIRYLSRMFRNFKSEQGSAQKKTRGGRLASHMRFHIDTLLGMGPNETRLPLPASQDAKAAWMRDIDVSTLDANSDPSVPTSQRPSSDPCFPYPDGPGHIRSTPQQLAVMWRMMRSVGVTSFQPNFSESFNSEDNRWLWDLALRIFTKLVECGEYSGVSLEPEHSAQIKRSLATYAASLSKRYREKDWDDQRKKKGADETRRKARMRHLKAHRDEIFLSKESLFCLSNIFELACSNDETDHELESPNKLRPAIPCRVRRLPWRSPQLEKVFISLDTYKATLTASIPKNTHGRPPRPRIRTPNAPSSPIKPPAGLPVDCYCSEWLAKLTPRECSTLDIQISPILPRVISSITNLNRS